MGLFSKLFGNATDPAPARLAGKQILVVEPSITIHKVIELTLSGSSIATANDASQAKEALKSNRFDLVIAAAILPDMAGYDLCAYVKRVAAPLTPVILLRGSFEPFDENRARHAGADAVVTKPFSPETLKAEVDRVLHESRSRDEIPRV